MRPSARDDRETQHVLAHRAVAHGVGARRARRRHAADRRVRAGIDREEESGALELGIQLLARDTGLHAAVEVRVVHFQHAIHLRQVEAHAAVQRRDVPLERRADAERDHRDPRRVAYAHDRRHFVVRVREHDDVRHRGVGQTFAVRMLLANCVRRQRAVTVLAAQPGRQRRHGLGLRPRGRLRGGVHRGLSKTRQFGMAQLAVMHVHPAEFGAPCKRRDALARIQQRLGVECRA